MTVFANIKLYLFTFTPANLHLRVVLSYFHFSIKWHAWREAVWGCVDGKSSRNDGWSVSASCSACTFANGNTFLLNERKTILRQSSPSTKRMKRLHKRLLSFFLFTLRSCQTLSWLGLPWQDRQTSMGLSLRLLRRLNSWYRNLISLKNCGNVLPFSCRSSSCSSAFAFHGLVAIYL